MRKPTEWNDTPELQDMIAEALEEGAEGCRIRCLSDEGGAIEISHEGRRFSLTLEEIL